MSGGTIKIPLTRRPWKIIRPANKPTTFPVLRVNSLPCYVKKEESEICSCASSDRINIVNSRELTFAIETAAKIIFANPNSVEDTPAT